MIGAKHPPSGQDVTRSGVPHPGVSFLFIILGLLFESAQAIYRSLSNQLDFPLRLFPYVLDPGYSPELLLGIPAPLAQRERAAAF